MNAVAKHGELAVPPLQESARIVVSVVMPCLNEANGVGVCVEKAWSAITRMQIEGEIIVVDNGSTDGSPEIALAAGQRSGARLRVVHERRRGYGAAYLRGFSEAQGDFIVMGDSDDTYPFEELDRFVAPLQNGFDMVMGNRFGARMEAGAMPWSHRYIGNPILSGMLRILFDTTVRDSHCGMRSFTRQAYERMSLRTQGMELASEIVVNALRERLKIDQIPIVYRKRIGDSKLESLRDAWRHVRFLMVFSPSYLFQLPGLALFLIGLLTVGYLAGGPRQVLGHTWDWHVLLFGAAALLLGYNLILFDILAKIYFIGAGFAQSREWLKGFLRVFSLERGLGLGVLLFCAGVGIEGWVIGKWLSAGGGSLMAVRSITIGMVTMVIGAQTAFASFLVSLMQIKHR
jgi:glycosyltransferase involved in cell wall biosynthesis